jgi:hypothetical protein
MPEIRMMQKTIQRELESMVGQVQTHHTRLAIKSRIEALLTGNGNDINHIDVYVGASKVDPTMVVITPMNVLTGMLMMGYHYPYYDVPKLLGKRYEDENGVWESFNNADGDPCFIFTPSGPCKTFSGYLYVDPIS